MIPEWPASFGSPEYDEMRPLILDHADKMLNQSGRMKLSRYELKESFHIDDGQLDGLSTQECFVLGYEYSRVCHKMDCLTIVTGQTVHRSNVDRLNKAAEARGHSPLKITEIPDEFYCQISWDTED